MGYGRDQHYSANLLLGTVKESPSEEGEKFWKFTQKAKSEETNVSQLFLIKCESRIIYVGLTDPI